MQPLTSRRNATQLRILDAAATLFADKGLDGTSMDDIAAHATVARGTLYYNFSSKEEIVLNIALRAFCTVDAQLRPRLEAGERAEALLQDLFPITGNWFLANRHLAHVVLTAPLRGDVPAVEIPTGRPSFRRLTHDILARGQERGEIRPDVDVPTLTQIASGVFVQAVLVAIQTGQDDSTDWLRALVRVLFEGMEAKS